LAFLGGDANRQDAVGTFLRTYLSPTLLENSCAAILVHHTNKPSIFSGDLKGSERAYQPVEISLKTIE
jgi:RecA-family ATPase